MEKKWTVASYVNPGELLNQRCEILNAYKHKKKARLFGKLNVTFEKKNLC